MTLQQCVCQSGWYGARCDTTTRPPVKPDPEPVCIEPGSFFFVDTSISGSNLATVPNTLNAKDCSTACVANGACNSWVYSGGACYLKTSTTRTTQVGTVAGIKCQTSGGTNQTTTQSPPTSSSVVQTSGTQISTSAASTAATTTTTTVGGANNLCPTCKGNPPSYGCNGGFALGYCEKSGGGGCSYSYQPSDSARWCCFKTNGCPEPAPVV
jgi:hypothetical protein